MIYCMSDIHGEYDRYLAMLELIQFSDQDILYVLGDAIDRHPNGVNVLEDIMGRNNVKMLLGNHEQMAWDALGARNKFDARTLWQQNGGSSTLRELLYIKTKEERVKILRFIRDLPECLDLEVNGLTFHLVHGYPGKTQEERIWERPEPDAPAPMPGATVIVGHTPTVFLAGDDGKPFRIWHGNGIICIDCGCGNKTEFRRLACLRLDDMAEFYV